MSTVSRSSYRRCPPASRCGRGKPYLSSQLRNVAAGTPVRRASSPMDRPSCGPLTTTHPPQSAEVYLYMMFKLGCGGTAHAGHEFAQPPDRPGPSIVAGRYVRRRNRRRAMIGKLQRTGLRYGRAYLAGFASIGVSFLAWARAGFGLVNVLRTYEKQ